MHFSQLSPLNSYELRDFYNILLVVLNLCVPSVDNCV
jgi:hypothetical protein